jgi:hypothetical protein
MIDANNMPNDMAALYGS